MFDPRTDPFQLLQRQLAEARTAAERDAAKRAIAQLVARLSKLAR